MVETVNYNSFYFSPFSPHQHCWPQTLGSGAADAEETDKV